MSIILRKDIQQETRNEDGFIDKLKAIQATQNKKMKVFHSV